MVFLFLKIYHNSNCICWLNASGKASITLICILRREFYLCIVHQKCFVPFLFDASANFPTLLCCVENDKMLSDVIIPLVLNENLKSNFVIALGVVTCQSKYRMCIIYKDDCINRQFTCHCNKINPTSYWLYYTLYLERIFFITENWGNWHRNIRCCTLQVLCIM